MKNDREVYFQSERTGYSHLYAVAFDGGEPRALTSGKWEVLNVRQSLRQVEVLPHRQQRVARTTSTCTRCPATAARSPASRHAPGKHAATVSPDDRWIADVYSYTNKPPELYVQENRPQQAAKQADRLHPPPSSGTITGRTRPS